MDGKGIKIFKWPWTHENFLKLILTNGISPTSPVYKMKKKNRILDICIYLGKRAQQYSPYSDMNEKKSLGWYWNLINC